MTHPEGRRPISVNQGPTNGRNYPFVCPSDDVSLLLADAYLSYDDVPCNFVRPFHVAWLYGFGADAAATPSFAPTPVHSHDILIRDANDEVIFDSTEAIDFIVVPWPETTPRMRIVEWKTATAVCRVTYHIEFGPNDVVKTYSISFQPTDGQLDARVADRRSPRVTSLRVGITTFGPAERVDLLSGYNVEQLVEFPGPTSSDGGRANARITLSAAPGGGIGRFPGCEDPDLVIRRINGVDPLSNGNFLFDAAGREGGGPCYAIRQPTTLLMNPDPAPAPPFLALPTEATLVVSNDCEPCCDCPDYIRTYEGLRRLRDRYLALGARAESVRDQHRLNEERWKEQRDCRLAQPCLVSVTNLPDRGMNMVGSLCLFGEDCVVADIELIVNIDGPSFTVREGATFRNAVDGQELYNPTVDGDNIHFFFENANPYSANFFITLLDFDAVGSVEITMTAKLDGVELSTCNATAATTIVE